MQALEEIQHLAPSLPQAVEVELLLIAGMEETERQAAQDQVPVFACQEQVLAAQPQQVHQGRGMRVEVLLVTAEQEVAAGRAQQEAPLGQAGLD